MFPNVLDPFLCLLEDKLPPSLYALLLNVVLSSLTLCSLAIRLVGTLLAKNPQDWDLQTILPPVVTILAAYLALASLYRTTSWLFRLSFWFIKWGFILGAFLVGVGWLAAYDTNGGSFGSRGLNGETSRTKVRPRGSMAEQGKKPRPWDKFDKTNEYKQVPQANFDEAQKIMRNIVENANQVFEESWWWQVGKAMVGNSEKAEERPRRKQYGRTRSR